MHAWLDGLGRPFDSFTRSWFYSDSHNDIPLLSVVSHPVATNPSEKLSQHATALGWTSLHLFND
jgi:phosphoserine phosphatase